MISGGTAAGSTWTGDSFHLRPGALCLPRQEAVTPQVPACLLSPPCCSGPGWMWGETTPPPQEAEVT